LVTFHSKSRVVVRIFSHELDVMDVDHNPEDTSHEGDEICPGPSASEHITPVKVGDEVDNLDLFDLPIWVHRNEMISLGDVQFPGFLHLILNISSPNTFIPSKGTFPIEKLRFQGQRG
jgi:hypothetical protein